MHGRSGVAHRGDPRRRRPGAHRAARNGLDRATDRGEIAWSLREDGQGTRVTLRARVEQAGVLDRLLLALGGEAWLLRCFGRVLARLAEAVPAPGDAAALHGAPACPQAG